MGKKELISVMILLIFMILVQQGCSDSGELINSETININEYIGTEDYDKSRPFGKQTIGFWMGGLIEGDVFEVYPKLKQQYLTDLQKENFLKTDEYKKFKENIKKELNILLQQTYKTQVGFIGSDNPYKLKEGAFIINVESVGPYSKLREEAMRRRSNVEAGFWFEDVPFRIAIDIVIERYIVLKVDKETATRMEKAGGGVYLIFNPTNSTKNGFVVAKNTALVVFNEKTNKTLYAVKFSNFDEKTAWKKIVSPKAAFSQQAPGISDTSAETEKSIEQLPQSIKQEASTQPVPAPTSEPSSKFNEELLGVKYVMTMEDGVLYCNVDDSWKSISDKEKREFLKQIGQKKYFGKTQFILKDSSGTNLAEYKNGNIKLSGFKDKGKSQVSLPRKYPVQQGRPSIRDEHYWQGRIEFAHGRVKHQENRIETFRQHLENAQRNPQETRERKESLREFLVKEEKILEEARREYEKIVNEARQAGIKVQ